MRGGISRWIGLSAILAAALCSGCKPASDGAVHIQIWHSKSGPERDLFTAAVARYNASHPGRVIDILYHEPEELRNLFVIASVAGQGPDLVYGASDNVGVFVTTQTIKPLDDLFPSAFFDRFEKEGIVEWEGKKWLAADQIGNQLTLVYDKKRVPTPPKTLDELITLGQQLTKNRDGNPDEREYGLTWSYREPFFFIPFLTAFGGWVMDDQGRPTLDTPQTVKALQFILDLRDKYRIIPKEVDYEIADMLFKERRAAMIINGPWSWAAYHIPEESLIAPLPFNTETGLWCTPMYAAVGYSINVNVPPERMDAVREVIEYLTSAEIQGDMATKLLTSPVDKAVNASPLVQGNPILLAARAQIDHCKPIPIRPQMRQIWDGMRGPYQSIMAGTVSAEEGARRMQRECEKNIADSQL